MEQQGQLTFLIADNDLDALDAKTSLLHELGYYNCLQAEDGAEAWAMFKNFSVDVVICSLDIPDVNGLSLLKIIRSQDEYADIPFILESAQVTPKLISMAGRAGVSDIIVSPAPPETFKQRVAAVIQNESDEKVIEIEQDLSHGVELMKAGRLDEALKSFEKIVVVHEHAEVYYNMGYIKSAKGQYHEALQCFRKATRLDNNFAKAYKQMADIYTKLGKIDFAEKCLQKAADIYMERRQDSEAEEIYEAVTRLKPDTTNVYNSLGIICRRQGRIEEAIRHYQKALKVHPKDENIYFNLSRAFLDLRDFANARKNLEKALELNPTFGPARELYRAVEMGFTLSG